MTVLASDGRYDRVYSTMTFHHLQPDAKHAAIAAAPELLEARFNRAVVLARQGRADDAHAAFRVALSLRPGWTAARWKRQSSRCAAARRSVRPKPKAHARR